MLDMSSLEFELIVNMRKESPEGSFTTDRYMAVWSDSDGRIQLIPGNFLHLTDEQRDQVLQDRRKATLII